MEYRIASFNMHNFGYDSSKKRDLAKIAEIIVSEELDIVALQEIHSEGKGVNSLLEDLKKYELYEWEYCFGVPKETSDISIIKNINRAEGYAYLWNKKRFKLAEYLEGGKIKEFQPRIINLLSNDVNVNCSVFSRTPYYIRLEPVYGGFFELRLINIHIYFGDKSLPSIIKRNIEFDLLTQEVYPDISTQTYGTNRFMYTIAMGDYNLNLFNPMAQDKNASIMQSVYSYEEQGKMINICTVQNELTTLKKDNGYANNYDHFTYSPELAPFLGVSIEAIDVVNKYCGGDSSYYSEKISDHLPILMKINI